MEPGQYLLLAGLGVVAGTLNVLAGGGSLLTLPVMVFLGLDGPVANGTNRVAILAQNVTAVGGFRARGFSEATLSLGLALAALPGAVSGAVLGTIVRGRLFNQILGAILIGVLVLMVLQGRKAKATTAVPSTTTLTRRRLVLGHLAMIGVGFYGGFIQAGVGFLLMAVLHRVMRLDLVRVNMHKVFIVGVFTLAALAVFAARGLVLWVPGLALAVGNSIGGWVGSQVSVTKGESWIRTALYGALVLMAIKLLWPA